MEKYAKLLGNLRDKNPLVHQITNYVTVNDCANITICIGAAPVMSHYFEDAKDMVKAADALVLNIGTLDDNQLEGMIAAGTEACKRNIPIVFDPVGAGATTYRTKTAYDLQERFPLRIIKGNAGEIGTLAGAKAGVKGVDCEAFEGDLVQTALKLANSSGATVVISGAKDIVSDGERVAAISNGVPLMSKISGTGCMATAVCAAFAASAKDDFDACVAAMTYLGIAGERAAEKSKSPGTFKQLFLDEVYNLSEESFYEYARLEEYR